MYKKKQFLKLEKKYSSYQEKGSVGTMMELCHRKLENDEHINSIFNLKSIIKYKYKNNIISEQYLPFRIKILDCNLFYNVTLKK